MDTSKTLSYIIMIIAPYDYRYLLLFMIIDIMKDAMGPGLWHPGLVANDWGESPDF